MLIICSELKDTGLNFLQELSHAHTLRLCFYHILEKLSSKSKAHPQGHRAGGRGNLDSDTGFLPRGHSCGICQAKGLAVAGIEKERCWGSLGFF